MKDIKNQGNWVSKIWDLSVQCFYKPKTVLKNKVYLKLPHIKHQITTLYT